MNSKKYHISKTKTEKEVTNLDIKKLDGYKITPKTKSEDAIEVKNVIFTNSELTEKVIRKKIDSKIAYLLYKLKIFESDGSDSGTIERSLMDAEKLRVQLINKYIKYLGHTYYSLTLKKIELIIEELNYKLYINEYYKENDYDNTKEGRRGR